jgi:hypothetical protein
MKHLLKAVIWLLKNIKINCGGNMAEINRIEKEQAELIKDLENELLKEEEKEWTRIKS